jgi:uncharacterized OB-fold protein
MMETKAKLQAPMERRLQGEYWSRNEDGAVQLTARECLACGACYLPGIATCVKCRSRQFGLRTLPPVGRLYTYTIVRDAGGVWPSEYAIGYVDYPQEEVRVCGHLREVDPAKLQIGMSLGLQEAVLYTDPDGTPVKSFRFCSTESA